MLDTNFINLSKELDKLKIKYSIQCYYVEHDNISTSILHVLPSVESYQNKENIAELKSTIYQLSAHGLHIHIHNPRNHPQASRMPGQSLEDFLKITTLRVIRRCDNGALKRIFTLNPELINFKHPNTQETPLIAAIESLKVKLFSSPSLIEQPISTLICIYSYYKKYNQPFKIGNYHPISLLLHRILSNYAHDATLPLSNSQARMSLAQFIHSLVKNQAGENTNQIKQLYKDILDEMVNLAIPTVEFHESFIMLTDETKKLTSQAEIRSKLERAYPELYELSYIKTALQDFPPRLPHPGQSHVKQLKIK